MANKRFQFGDRRQNNEMPRVPFKDSNGKLILVCRRRIPDRRLHNIEAEWIDEVVIKWDLRWGFVRWYLRTIYEGMDRLYRINQWRQSFPPNFLATTRTGHPSGWLLHFWDDSLNVVGNVCFRPKTTFSRWLYNQWLNDRKRPYRSSAHHDLGQRKKTGFWRTVITTLTTTDSTVA